ncbi:MAG: hypothetical protein HC866_09075 [Leptolyngbyaceae cyanobacterium RU_5_1]|nr:hypothetical protein [Leptolyngbyaceae cyanobacterium RU_5_1]
MNDNDLPGNLDSRILLILYCHFKRNPGDPRIPINSLIKCIQQVFYSRNEEVPDREAILNEVSKFAENNQIKLDLTQGGDMGSITILFGGREIVKDFLGDESKQEKLCNQLMEALDKAKVHAKSKRSILRDNEKKKREFRSKGLISAPKPLQNEALNKNLDVIKLLQIASEVQPTIGTFFNTSQEFFIAFEKHLIQASQIQVGQIIQESIVMNQSNLAPKLFRKVSIQLQRDMEILQRNHKDWQELWAYKPVIQKTIDCLERMQFLMDDLSGLLEVYEDYIQSEILDLCRTERRKFVRIAKDLGVSFKGLNGQLIVGSHPNIRDLNLGFNELQYYLSKCRSWLDEFANKSQQFQQASNR